LYKRPFLAAFSRYVSALAPKFCMKNAGVNVDEIDSMSIAKLKLKATDLFVQVRQYKNSS